MAANKPTSPDAQATLALFFIAKIIKISYHGESFGNLNQTEDQMSLKFIRIKQERHEELNRRKAAEKLKANLEQQATAERNRRLFGWPGVLRTLGWCILALIVIIAGGSHVIGYW